MVLCNLLSVSVSVTLHLMIVKIIFSSVLVVEWPPFRKGLFTRLTIFSLCILTVIFVISRFGFEGRIGVLIAQVPGHFLLLLLLFLLVLRIGCVIIVWHSLGLPYGYFKKSCCCSLQLVIGVSFGDISPYDCKDYIQFGLGC